MRCSCQTSYDGGAAPRKRRARPREEDGAHRTHRALQVDLTPPVVRTDAIQSFVSQETPIVRIIADRRRGGHRLHLHDRHRRLVRRRLLTRDHSCPELIGRDPAKVEEIWRDLFFLTHATAVGADHRAGAGRDRHGAVGPALPPRRPAAACAWPAARSERIRVYTTEGGWLHIERRGAGRGGAGGQGARLRRLQDQDRQAAGTEDVQPARGGARGGRRPDFEIMVDANQALRRRRGDPPRRALRAPLDLAWFEEPLPAEDSSGHVRLAQSTSTMPIAVGEIASTAIGHFREYLQRGACSIVQVDVARIGGITPWLKIAHLAETFNIAGLPAFPDGAARGAVLRRAERAWVEYIPQLDAITTSRMRIEDGYAMPARRRGSASPGIGRRSSGWRWRDHRRRSGNGDHAEARKKESAPLARRRWIFRNLLGPAVNLTSSASSASSAPPRAPTPGPIAPGWCPTAEIDRQYW